MIKLFSAVVVILVVTICSISVAISDFVSGDDHDSVTFLKQGWSDLDRLQYYYTSQGTAVLPYDVFLNLENATSTDLFSSDKILTSFGLFSHEADPTYNPDGLPVGLTKTRIADGRWKGEWAGITCAACHTSQLRYNGAQVRIDGGAGSSFDFMAFVRGLDDTLAATIANPNKFERLAAKLKRKSKKTKDILRKQLNEAAAQIHYYRTKSALTPFDIGPGRADCLGLIYNRVASSAMGIPENWISSLAPTKLPFLWNAPQSSWIQWSGVAANPLNRNAGEALGVFIKLDLSSKTEEEGLFDSTLDLQGQIEIEKLLRRLAPPKWPEEIFGSIDREKAAAGEKLFVKNCFECHSVYPHRWSEPKLQGKRFIENALVPLEVVGTDPMQFKAPEFNGNPSVMTGAMRDYLPDPYKGAALAPYGQISLTVNQHVQKKVLAKLKLTDEELADASGYRHPGERGPQILSYKAAPRDGVWSTGPFLHNGSVPNLYEMLLPASERSKTFYRGRDFDPVKVGVDTSGHSGTFLFDTSFVGNSNQGHSFEDGPKGKGVIGRKFTDDERWALVEYLKSIPTVDAQITPFGGPGNPVEAWRDPVFFHNNHKTGYDGK